MYNVDESVVHNFLGQSLIIPRSTRAAFRRHGSFDRLGLEVMIQALQKMEAPVALDIGANIGNHTVVLAKYCRKVHAFEPQLRTGIRLRDNVRLNGLKNVVLHDVGLSDQEGMERLYLASSGTGGQSTFVPDLAHAGGKCVDLPVRRGDELLRECGVDRVHLIKLDVEGFEARVLAGLAGTIARDHPLIFMEWNNDATRKGLCDATGIGTLFTGWERYAIIDSHSRAHFGTSLAGRARRWFAKLFRKRRALLVPVDFQRDYENVVLVPPGKMTLLHGS